LGVGAGGQTLFMNEHCALRRQRVTHPSFPIAEIYYAFQWVSEGGGRAILATFYWYCLCPGIW